MKMSTGLKRTQAAHPPRARRPEADLVWLGVLLSLLSAVIMAVVIWLIVR